MALSIESSRWRLKAPRKVANESTPRAARSVQNGTDFVPLNLKSIRWRRFVCGFSRLSPSGVSMRGSRGGQPFGGSSTAPNGTSAAPR